MIDEFTKKKIENLFSKNKYEELIKFSELSI